MVMQVSDKLILVDSLFVELEKNIKDNAFELAQENALKLDTNIREIAEIPTFLLENKNQIEIILHKFDELVSFLNSEKKSVGQSISNFRRNQQKVKKYNQY